MRRELSALQERAVILHGQGKSDQQAAWVLHTTKGSVRSALAQARLKLGAKTSKEAAEILSARGLLPSL